MVSRFSYFPATPRALPDRTALHRHDWPNRGNIFIRPPVDLRVDIYASVHGEATRSYLLARDHRCSCKKDASVGAERLLGRDMKSVCK